jgi:hypothetical protein
MTRLVGDQHQQAKLWQELRNLNEVLLSQIPAYERQHQDQLTHHGSVYMEVMHKDIPLLTKWANAIGVLAAHS